MNMICAIKDSAFGIGNEALARKMNSILATLELCDDSIVQLLEDLGHQHYKDKLWCDNDTMPLQAETGQYADVS